MKDLFKETVAFRIISEDKKRGKLSHCYLLCVEDGELLDEYLKQAAKLVACGDESYCGNCRVCRLIDADMHPDVTFYPKEKKLSVADADDLVAQSVVRPLELDKRIFAVSRPETLNQNQNKLLKTVEEPPKNVYILLGAEKASAILPTIRSRAKTIFVPNFTTEELLDAAHENFPDRELAAISALVSGGKFGALKKRYADENTRLLFNAAADYIANASSAKDMPRYVSALSSFSDEDILTFFKVIINEITRVKCGNKSIIDDKRIKDCADIFPFGALVAVAERLTKLEKDSYFNGNATMIRDAVLFSVLEEKAKWLRL